ncbi:MAG: Hint domain-containing protein [Marinosulfonomonas sp.]|nr:Hint domain-containing protein [Marinosulfonomonas sp.]
MGWQFVTDFSKPRHRADNFVPARKRAAAARNRDRTADNLLVRGSLVVEFELSADGQVPARLIHYENNHNWSRRFTVYLNADNSISIEIQQGPARIYARLSNWTNLPVGPTRLTYAWDAPEKSGLLTLESLNSGSIRQVVVDAPMPLPRSDLEVVAKGGMRPTDHRLTFIAIADSVRPVGPAPTIAKGTLVETSQGPRPIDRLQRGDEVLTAQYGMQPVRWIIKQELPTYGSYRPVRLRAPYLGLTRDITVSQHHHVRISGADAEYLFGAESVLVQARHLLSHPAATLGPQGDTQTYYQLLLDHHDCICLCGAWGESLFIGDLRTSPALMETTHLNGLAASAAPRHRRLEIPMLRSFESKTLLDAISA